MKKMSPDSEREQRLRQRQRHAFLLDPAERGEAEHEVQRRGGDERIGRGDVHRAQIEQQRQAEQQRAANRAKQPDDPQDSPRRARDQFRQWLRGVRGNAAQRFGSHSSHGEVGRYDTIIGGGRLRRGRVRHGGERRHLAAGIVTATDVRRGVTPLPPHAAAALRCRYHTSQRSRGLPPFAARAMRR